MKTFKCSGLASGGRRAVADSTKMFVSPKLFNVSAYFLTIQIVSKENDRKAHKGTGVTRTSKPPHRQLQPRVFS